MKIIRKPKIKVTYKEGCLVQLDLDASSEIVKKAGAICVKTATEKDPLENRELEEKARHLRIMKKASSKLLIKASGKIKTLKDLKLMVKSGANIIGASASVKIMKELKSKK